LLRPWLRRFFAKSAKVAASLEVTTMSEFPNDSSDASPSEDRRYRLMVEAVTDYAIYMLDAGGHVTSWNAGGERFKGYNSKEILGKHFSLFYTAEDRATGLPARALATAASEGRFESEGWRVRKDGGQFWAHVVIDPIRTPEGTLIGFAKITRDLTERRRAEETLKRSQEQFQLLVRGVADYAIYMLDVTGHVSNWNLGAQRIKGYEESEIVGMHFSRFYTEQDRARGEPNRTLTTAEREGRFEAEGWRVRKDGSLFWANVVVDALRDPAGKLIGYAKITRDVTEKRDAQRALEKAREALFQSQKMDAIGRLTGGVAHDFNNILMAVLGSLSLLKKRVGSDAKAATLVENATLAARRGASLTQRMLAFARRQALQPEPVHVRTLLEAMGELLIRTLGPTLLIEAQFPPHLPPAMVDANQLELAVLNLAANARDAMPNGGKIVIAGALTTFEAGSAEQAKLNPGKYLCLSVTDQGEGMDEATLARAAEPFFTTKGVGKGTGLGLSMVDGLAAQSGGRFELSSTPGVGTIARLWLPVAVEEPVRQAPTVSAPAAPIPPQVVLVVDDDALVLKNHVAMLEDLGHTVVPAASATEALEILSANEQISVMVTDHAMPRMTGAELIQKVRVQRPELPTILATGFAELSGDLAQGIPRLSKPFDQEELAEALADVVKR